MDGASSLINGLPPGDGDKVTEILEVIWICNGFVALIFILRMFSKWKVTRNIGLEDWIVAVSVVSFLAAIIGPAHHESNPTDSSELVKMIFLTDAGVVTKLALLGFAKRPDEINPADLGTLQKLSFANQEIATVAALLPKAAIVLMLLKLMGPTSHGKWVLHGILGLLIPVGIVWCVLTALQCIPLEGLWNPEIRANCSLSQPSLSYATFGSGIVFPCSSTLINGRLLI